MTYKQMIKAGIIIPDKVNKQNKTKKNIKNINELDKGDGSYGSFLKSEYWKCVRTCIIKRDSHRCQLCGNTKNLVVHHLTYEHHFDEFNHKEDLVTLCSGCHENVHKVKYIEKELLHKIGYI